MMFSNYLPIIKVHFLIKCIYLSFVLTKVANAVMLLSNIMSPIKSLMHPLYPIIDNHKVNDEGLSFTEAPSLKLQFMSNGML